MSATVFKNILGDGYCDDRATLEACAAQGVVPACVCAPADEKQAATVIQQAAAHLIQLAPFGSGTQQGNGRAPVTDFVALSTRRMNALIQHEPGDMVASVQAGMQLGAFQEALGGRGQWLPTDGDPRSTIGGLLSTAYSGTLATGYGTLRDVVLGMTIIHGDGVLRKCGGKVVKNVTGYPLEKLYIGALGTLGLVTEVTFKLQPLPIARTQWVAEFNGDAHAGFVLLSAVCARNLPLERLFLKLDENTWRLYAQAVGTAKELDRIDAELRASGGPFMRTEIGTSWIAAVAPEEVHRGRITLRFWSLHSKLEAVTTAVAGIKKPDSAALSANGGRFSFEALDAASAARLSESLIALGANYRFESVGTLRIEAPYGPARADFSLMRRIKESLDPRGIFNRGRFVV